MLKAFARWLIPGAIVVVGGTALTVMSTQAGIVSDLKSRSISTLAEQGDNWVEIGIDSRDLVLHGTASTEEQVAVLEDRLRQMHGVRSVTADVTVAPLAKPYLFAASIADGKIVLRGGVPDAQTQKILVASAGAVDVDLHLNSGLPQRSTWLAATDFAIDQLKSMDQGSVTLRDLTLTIDGRATNDRAYGDALLALQHPPAGVQLAAAHIDAPLASPYEWAAQSDGRRISITGFVPDNILADRYHTADVGGLEIATGVSTASGAPQNFAEDSQTLLLNLAKLEYGAVTIIDGHRALTGAAPNLVVAQAVTQAVKPTGAIVVLEAPKVDDFHLNGVLGADGKLTFSGNIPDEVSRQYLTALPKADVSKLMLARGGPDRFQSALEFAVTALQKMSQGQFELAGDRLTVSGIAASAGAYKSLIGLKQSGAPQGFQLAVVDVKAPRANPYTWTATKAADGTVSLDGYVPDAKTRSDLRAAIRRSGADNTSFASGEPKGFQSAAGVGLSLLNSVKTGSVRYDGTGWTLSGTADATALNTIKATFTAQNLAASGWSLDVNGPTTATTVPYIWSATRDADGKVNFAGHIPNAGLQKYLQVRAGGTVADASTVDASAPADFVSAVWAGFDVLLTLDSGKLSFDGMHWSLTGSAPAAVVTAAKSALAQQIKSADWQVQIAEAATPQPAAPYRWSATREGDGAVSFTGAWPTDTLKRFIAARVGTVANDTSTIDAAAPKAFTQDVLAAASALSKLETGSVAFDGKAWSISGDLVAGATEADIDSILSSAATPAKDWRLALTTKPAPVAEAKPEPAQPTADPAYSFSASRTNGGPITLSGQVPAEPARRYFAVITGANADTLTIAPNAPADFLTAAGAGLHELATLSEGKLTFANGKWSLSGTVAGQASKDAVTKAIAALPNGSAWTLDISAPAAIEACRAVIVDWSQTHTILFKSGASVIVDESKPALDALAKDLALCPDNIVEVEGHTDADGDADANMALSVARSEAVIKALIDRNILAARLYAVGYGESKPIASNDTDAGKRQNRRIVINIVDHHY